MKKYFATVNKEPTENEIEHGKIVHDIAGDCIVLMKNDDVLPLSKNICQINLYGNGARRTIHGGGGSGCVNARNTIVLERAFQDTGFYVNSIDWMDRYDDLIAKEEALYWQRINEKAKELGVIPKMLTLTDHFRIPDQPLIEEKELIKSDDSQAIYVISRRSREGEDLKAEPGGYYLSEHERQNLNILSKHFENLVVLINTGAPIDTSFLLSLECNLAIVQMGQLGNTGALSLIEMLTGNINPSGHLVDTWAQDYADYPNAESFVNGGSYPDDVEYSEGLFIGYRYFDSYNIKPAFPFGFGLSYTSFEWHPRHKIELKNEIVSVEATVKNIGKVSGKDVVQLYCGYPMEGLVAPKKVLRAFSKTKCLKPQESQTLELSFSLLEMAVYREEDACWVLQKGEYPIYIGSDVSTTEIVAQIIIEEECIIEQCMNLFEDKEPVKELDSPNYVVNIPADVPVLCWDGRDLETKKHSYSTESVEYKDVYEKKITFQDILLKKHTTKELVAQLTDEEMAWMCIGNIDTDVKEIIGSSSGLVPGAAGDTCHILEKSRGVPGCIMADGPAGLRLIPEFEDEGTTYYQYCTAIPTASTLAQSWDPQLTKLAGQIVGQEMESFGVKLWLAPAMNLHRNPLCGRNFEYFSEDPYLSARFAQSMVGAVQSFKGRGVVLKHFACNNQENNRLYVNEHISQRALRELYLKGFEMVIRNENPISIMASYNLINGYHCASNYDLLVHVLRNEWGYDGMIMTDWFSTQNIKWMMGIGETRFSHTDPVECIKSGVSVQMPGNPSLVEEVKDAIDNNRIHRQQLQQATLYLLNAIVKLQ